MLKLIYEKGTQWSEISRHMEGRTANSIKNHYNQNLKKRVSPGEFLKPSDMPEIQREGTLKPVIAPSTPVKSSKTVEVSTTVKEQE